jgi:hypothetical protein
VRGWWQTALKRCRLTLVIPGADFPAVIPGRGRHLPDANPESRSVWLYGDSNVEIPGSVPSPSAPVPPRNDECGAGQR